MHCARRRASRSIRDTSSGPWRTTRPRSTSMSSCARSGGRARFYLFPMTPRTRFAAHYTLRSRDEEGGNPPLLFRRVSIGQFLPEEAEAQALLDSACFGGAPYSEEAFQDAFEEDERALPP